MQVGFRAKLDKRVSYFIRKNTIRWFRSCLFIVKLVFDLTVLFYFNNSREVETATSNYIFFCLKENIKIFFFRFNVSCLWQSVGSHRKTRKMFTFSSLNTAKIS